MAQSTRKDLYGFETAGDYGFAISGGTSSTMFLNDGSANTGCYYMKTLLQTSGGYAATRVFTALTIVNNTTSSFDLRARFYLKMVVAPDVSSTSIFHMGNGQAANLRNIALRVNTDLSWEVYNDFSTPATATGGSPIPLDTWVMVTVDFLWKRTTNVSDKATMSITVNGQTLTIGENTFANILTSTISVDRIGLGSVYGSGAGTRTAGEAHYDDVVISWTGESASIGASAILPDQTRIHLVPATGQGASAAWTGSYTDVLEVPLDTGGAGQTSSGAGQVTTFTHQTLALLGGGTVGAFKVYAHMKSASGTATQQIRLNGVDYPVSITTTYQIAANTPMAIEWSPTGFDASEMGVVNTTGASLTLGAIQGEILMDDASWYGCGPAPPLMLDGVLGPLAWLEMTRYVAPGSGESPLRVHFYSDHDMQCPGSWYGGFKEGRVTRWSDATRTLSDVWTGDWQGSTFSVSVSDYDLSIRQRLASPTERFWTLPCVCRMTTRENRAALGIPYIVFVGPIVDAQPTRSSIAWDLTLGDSVSHTFMSDDQGQLPWRQVRDSFLSQLDEIATSLDIETPEPIIYGEHLRVPDVDPPSPQGFVYAPTYLGIQTISFGICHVWLVAGHACADILDVYYDNGADPITSVIADEGVEWLVPHYGGWAGEFLDPNFIDMPSDTYASFRRYTLIYGLVGQTNPDNCAAGAGWAGPPGGPAPTASYTLLVAVQGVEPVGDGTGTVILDRFQQYEHFLINFVAYKGLASYQLYTWLTNPTWDLYDGLVPVIDEDSFDEATAIGEERLPSVGSPSPPTTAGYIGAAIIGARVGHRKSVREWIAEWNRSCGCRFGITHKGQMRIAVLHPTQAIKDAAPLFTDGYEILDQSFNVDVRWGDQANAIPWKTDFEHATGQWKTLGVEVDYVSTGLYGRMFTAESREYPFAPGSTMATHLALLELRLRADPPRQVILSTNVDNDMGLGTLELGDYFRYIDYATVAESPADERLAQVQSITINPGTRQVTVVAIDCEDHLGYDTET